MIALKENVSQDDLYIIEIASLLHDIACPLCREKYGNTLGIYQEKEGIILARKFLSNFNVSENIIDKVCYLIGHHHTYKEINDITLQILVEADFLVNADESHYSNEIVSKYYNDIFKTRSGLFLLKSMYMHNL